MNCPLCKSAGDISAGDTPAKSILWQDDRCRVIAVDEPGYPGFCRVIWSAHVKEMTDLAPGDRQHLMTVVFAVESTLREFLSPDKINLASLGNQVAHLHWHVIPRFADDPHFPDAVWATRKRAGAPRLIDCAELAGRITTSLSASLSE